MSDENEVICYDKRANKTENRNVMIDEPKQYLLQSDVSSGTKQQSSNEFGGGVVDDDEPSSKSRIVAIVETNVNDCFKLELNNIDKTLDEQRSNTRYNEALNERILWLSSSLLPLYRKRQIAFASFHSASVSKTIIMARNMSREFLEDEDEQRDSRRALPSILKEIKSHVLLAEPRPPTLTNQPPKCDVCKNESCELISPVQQIEAPATFPTRPDFSMGDHVYQWVTFIGIPRLFQHHGIVVDVLYDDLEGEWFLLIADFGNWTQGRPTQCVGGVDDTTENEYTSSESPSRSSMSKNSLFSNSQSKSCIQVYNSKIGNWHKVQYSASFWTRNLSRSGTATSAESSPPALVRARIDFLRKHPDYLPPYSALSANCECVAVWCKTGTWATLQATVWLAASATGHANSTAALAGYVATAEVTVPASGIWGSWLGYTTQVSLASTQPYLVPAIAIYGIVSTGVPILLLLHAKSKWSKWTVELNNSFFAYWENENAVKHPEVL